MKYLRALLFALFLFVVPSLASADGPPPGVVPVHHPIGPATKEPNGLIIEGTAGIHATLTKKQVHAIVALYHHLLVLPPVPKSAICPHYVVADIHLTFLYDRTVLLHATIQQGGCNEVIFGPHDIRSTDYSLDGLLNRVGVPTKPHTRAQGGYTPLDLQSAYNLPSATSGRGQTVAIVDAFNAPRAESDMAVYRRKFGLPACTHRNHCFRKVNQGGGSWMPTESTDWDGEISLDLDMVSAICPLCHILLVEATSASFEDLGRSVDTAQRLGAKIISNSYGSVEDAQAAHELARYYNHPGVVVVASSGDNGYGVQIPAAFAGVIAVGGTTLSRSPNGYGWTETAWSGSGSGCSAFVDKPVWQHDPGCSNRSVVDVSAVADPGTGVQAFSNGQWWSAGGTSAAAPIIAGVYALAGNASTTSGNYLYGHELEADFNDVSNGSNGTCDVLYLCIAGIGYDGPTGLGTPNGVGAF